MHALMLCPGRYNNIDTGLVLFRHNIDVRSGPSAVQFAVRPDIVGTFRYIVKPCHLFQ